MLDSLQDGTLVQMLLLLCDKFPREPRTPWCGSFGFFDQLRKHEPTTSSLQTIMLCFYVLDTGISRRLSRACGELVQR
jgi:hypothetical protein